MNKFSKNIKNRLTVLTIKDKFLRWFLNVFYKDTSIIKDVSIYKDVRGEIVFDAKNLFPVGDVYIKAGTINLNPEGYVRKQG